jgi:CRP/FNR family cyclic AMP-dependent transcriptional regulator
MLPAEVAAHIGLQSQAGIGQTIRAHPTYKMCNPDHEEIVSHVTADSAEHELFEGLNDHDLAALGERFAIASFRKGELIYSPYDLGDALFLIESGRVRLFRSASDGRQVTLALLDPGSSFGQITMLDHSMHDAYAEAMADCVLRVLRLPELERALAEHPRIALNLMRSLAERLHDAEDQIESLAFRPVPARLAGKLLELMDRYGRVTPTGIRIDERFTHMQLAEMIGTSRETLTKVLNELRDEHLIDVRERLVWVIDADGLDRVKRSA